MIFWYCCWLFLLNQRLSWNKWKPTLQILLKIWCVTDTWERSWNFLLGLFLSNRGCYGRWIANLQFCYFIPPNSEKTWYEARESCVKKHRGNLVSIGSLEEDNFLEDVLLQTGNVSSCMYIGLQTGRVGLTPSWVDGNFWNFSKLSYDLENGTDLCANRGSDGLWHLSNCSKKCRFICKRYRGGSYETKLQKNCPNIINFLAFFCYQSMVGCGYLASCWMCFIFWASYVFRFTTCVIDFIGVVRK